MTYLDAETQHDGAQGVVVHGMGRSGTSAITGLFVRSGFYVGPESELIPAAEDNPAGFNENLNVLQINEAALADLAGTWFDPPEEGAQSDARARWEPQLASVLSDLMEAAAPAPLVLKDPRIEVLLPLWDGLLRGVFHPVVAVRHPVEIALSLSKRERMPLPIGLATWEIHMTTLLRHLRGVTATVAPYRLLMSSHDSARRIVTAAVERLDPTVRARVEPTDGSGWLRPDLYRNRAQDIDLRGYLTAHQQELWAWLEALPLGNLELDPPDSITHTSDAARAAVAAERELVATVDKLAAAERREVELQARCDRLAEEHAGLNAEHAALVAEYERLRDIYVVVMNSSSWRLTRPLRAMGEKARSVTRTARNGGGA